MNSGNVQFFSIQLGVLGWVGDTGLGILNWGIPDCGYWGYWIGDIGLEILGWRYWFEDTGLGILGMICVLGRWLVEKVAGFLCEGEGEGSNMERG